MMVMTKSLCFKWFPLLQNIFQTIVTFSLHSEEVDNADKILFFTDKNLEADLRLT